MKRTTLYVASSLAVLLSVAAIGIGAAVDTPRTLMSRADYNEARTAIELHSRVALARCREADGSARDLCKAEARAEEKLKKADLQARYHGTVAAAADAKQARAKALYEVAKVRCGLETDSRASCLRTARDSQARALVDSKLAAAT